MREPYGRIEQALMERLGMTFVGGTSSQPPNSYTTLPMPLSVAPTHDASDIGLKSEDEFNNRCCQT
ncbi:hypothetical protein Scep_021546 [Stephania cephalantha]|uniref:Uncharacterized protein n=1 Tax=Stephania cephalantha TaxID=152367 RepID=A0AAP0F962_9MAGN